ncbi:MAG: DUF3500 domain-containing protein [Acidobacteriota bacterium]|nr:DUF3500 domain-containing protein [Acidobacteriota bacterium]
MKKFVVACLCCIVPVLFFALHQVAGQQTPDRLAQFREQLGQALAEPFKGVTTDGKVVPGLFGVRHTGVSTKPVREAADAFLNGLSEEQRKKTVYPADAPEWRSWDNRHFPPRAGVGFRELSERQRELAFSLFRASLSAKGLQKTQDIMKLNETLAELANNFDEYGQWLYWITVMGKPSDTEPWGWQLDGHHLIINYFVLGDQVVMTPTFMGSEPVRAESGKFKGTMVMQDEQNKGLKLFLSLDKDQQAKAVIRGENVANDSLAQAYKDNLVLNHAGIPASGLNDQQKKLLLELTAEYVGNMKDGHARVKMDEVRDHLDRTYFAWIGSTDPNGVFYYRVQSPVILIEFDHQSRVAPIRTNTPTRDHIHTVVRTPNGNDYGKDLLRQHHEKHPHGGQQDQPQRR